VERAKTDPQAAAIVAKYFHRPTEELYDLAVDPHEQRNLAANPEHEQKLIELRERLDKWMKEQNDEGLPTEQAAEEALPGAMPAATAGK
jgi:uncharacterized sulfatase